MNENLAQNIKSIKKRIFITNGNAYFKAFTFNQNKKGDIYIGFPNFQKTKWLSHSKKLE